MNLISGINVVLLGFESSGSPGSLASPGGSLTLYIDKWSGVRESNSRHSAWEADALPTELTPHN